MFPFPTKREQVSITVLSGPEFTSTPSSNRTMSCHPSQVRSEKLKTFPILHHTSLICLSCSGSLPRFQLPTSLFSLSPVSLAEDTGNALHRLGTPCPLNTKDTKEWWGESLLIELCSFRACSVLSEQNSSVIKISTAANPLDLHSQVM